MNATEHAKSWAPMMAAAGYTLGMYGKFLNVGGMDEFCANQAKHAVNPPGAVLAPILPAPSLLCHHLAGSYPSGWTDFFALCPDTCYINWCGLVWLLSIE